MDIIKTILILVFGIPLGLILMAAIWVVASSLWLIFLPWKILDYVFEAESEALLTFEEFIFTCYGLGAICILIPIEVLGDETID